MVIFGSPLVSRGFPLHLLLEVDQSDPSRNPSLRPWGIRLTDHATTLYPQKLALTSPTSGGSSVDIVRSRTKATELVGGSI
jgi:hypothetical protein